MIEHAPLQSVYIYFDTATYDEIERDVKVILRAWGGEETYVELTKGVLKVKASASF